MQAGFQRAAEAGEFGFEDRLGDLAFAGDAEGVEVGDAGAGLLGVAPQRAEAGGIDHERGGRGEELVAGGAVHGPRVGHVLIAGEDVLDEDGQARRALRRLVEGRAEAGEVFEGIAQAVDVVHADGVDAAAGGEVDDPGVGLAEDFRVFDAEAGEVGDVEEAAVVDAGQAVAPEGEFVVLGREEFGERGR
ncbi:MAG TPA: hypothetical protein PKE29_08680 [Phycisphaerales bacterium]|nr:hypothetical protein [Phycisphaerales bacterium]